jgi:coniferyl-aldehyde dehydrogenase
MNTTLSLHELMALQLAEHRRASLAEGLTPLPTRLDRIRRLEAVLAEHQAEWCAALDADFAGRPAMQSRMELYATLDSLRQTSKHLKHWMKPERRPVPWMLRLLGARAEVFYQPLGVVGIVAPWNFPLVLALGPLGAVFAAGNRAMLKPSELASQTSALMKRLLAAAFGQEEVTTWLGGPEVGAAFTAQAFDHLLFTGAPSVARHAMRAAADNLVPVTLELGGKCPVIIGPDAHWDLAVDRTLWGKIQNAGQICLAPDYVFLPQDRIERFIADSRAKVAGWYPRIKDNADYCSIINERHHERLTGYVAEARARGVRVEVLDAERADFSGQAGRRMPPTLIVEPPEDLAVMQDEVFGPLLSVRGYTDLAEVIAFINARPRPLALYYFGGDPVALKQIKERTTSGGITVNDIAAHAALESLPLGGVGNSGMGRYHGHDGFVTFSHPKAVLRQGRISLGRLFNPPYDERKRKMLDRTIGRAMD